MTRLYTQKHYIAIAKEITQLTQNIFTIQLTELMIKIFKTDSSKFDETKFREYIKKRTIQ